MFQDLRVVILDELRRLYGGLSLVDLAGTADVLDTYAKERFRAALAEFAPVIFGIRFDARAENFIGPADSEYRLQVGDDVKKFSLCLASITPLLPQQGRLQRLAVPIVATGRYRRVSIYYPAWLPVRSDLLPDITKCVFETAYSWYKNQIDALLDNERSRLTTNAYRKLRDLFPEPALHERIWLAVVTLERGFRLLDPIVVSSRMKLHRISDRNCTLFDPDLGVKAQPDIAP